MTEFWRVFFGIGLFLFALSSGPIGWIIFIIYVMSVGEERSRGN